MEFVFISPGKTRQKGYSLLLDHYLQQIQHHAKASWVVVKEAGEDQSRETENILQHLDRYFQSQKSAPKIVILDERGQQWDSQQFSEAIQNWWNAGTRPIVFLIGGAFGFDHAKLEQHSLSTQWERLALSRFTFPHELARVVLTEQVYRALHIQRGSKYHH